MMNFSTDQLGSLIRQHVRALLEAEHADEAFRFDRIDELEAKGRIIVGGGQVSRWYDDNTCEWDVTDWRTGKVLAAGRSSMADQETEMQRLDPDDKWFHIDQVEMPMTDVTTAGMPDSLAEALRDWTVDRATADELVTVTGWEPEALAALHRNRDQ